MNGAGLSITAWSVQNGYCRHRSWRTRDSSVTRGHKSRAQDSCLSTASGILLSAAVTGAASSVGAAADCRDLEILQQQAANHVAELCDAARKGDTGAMYWLGLAYLEGQILNDYDRGLAWLKKAAFRGNEEAQRMYDFISSAEVGPGC